MKRIYFLLIVLTFSLCTGCKTDVQIDKNDNVENELDERLPAQKDREFDSGSTIVFPELNNQLIVDLELLGKIWGFLKYHHYEVGKGNYNWDYELFRILPAYLKVKNTEERDKMLLDRINKYGEIPPCKTCKETSPDAYIKPNLRWAEKSNMNSALKAKIEEIYTNRYQGEHYYIRKPITSSPEFLHESLYNSYFPDAGFRLLALFRYWNMIHYFFPYKYLTDKNWDDILPEYIPLVIKANNRLEYETAMSQLICEINDTHAEINNDLEIQKLRGDYYAPFRVGFIEGKLVVKYYYNPELMDTTVIKIGDVITHINGETVDAIIEKRKNYYPASNNAARLRNMSYDMLRSPQKTFSIQTDRAGQITIQLFKEVDWLYYYRSNVDKNEKCYKLLDGNIVYINSSTLKPEDSTAIKNVIRNTKGIIIDIRNYPTTDVKGLLSYYFVSKNTPFVKYSKANADNPGEFTFSKTYDVFYSGETYKGKLIVIVNEVTQSSAEFTAMAFRAGDNTTIIGSTTAGADGTVSTVNLPGVLNTRFTGTGVYYPDGTGTQRVGIIPDVWVEPTIEGIREGRDELLEKAISLINEEK